MPGVAEQLATRLPPGIAFGLAIAALLWLLGLLRPRGAGSAFAWLLAAFLAGAWPVAGLVAGLLAVAGGVGRAVQATDRAALPTTPGARAASSLCAVTVAAAVAASLSERPGLWLVAPLVIATGAAAAAAAGWSGILVTGQADARRYHPLSLRPCAGTPGLSGPALGAAAITATLVVGLATWLDVLGPGQGGTVALAGLAGLAVSTVPSNRSGLGTSRRTLLGSLVGAAATAGLVAFLP